MKSCSTNDVKIYNLSSGKSLPDWLTERKKRSLQRKESKDVDVRRKIELIQDFDMPGLSSNIQLTPDGQYILATGIYKPRLRCYDVKNLSMKFERCFDSEVVKFLVLSEDYSKLVFLQCDRFIEFHSQGGRYYRLRIPKFGHDLAYHTPSCDMYVVGATHEAYRLNLELGRFMTPFETQAKSINRVVINPVHHLVLFGTEEGHVEAWDPRAGHKVGTLDAALHSISDNEFTGIPSVTSLTFKDGLTLGVGVATGQVLLYDIRSSRPIFVKDHYYSLPIKDIEFHKEENMVMSMDTKIVKIWNEKTGEPFTSVEDEAPLNDLCLVPNTGMFFVANENRKILTYFIPSLGPAPRWCSFLDNLTEELEETDILQVYDDYKFISEKELHEIGLSHLIGTNLLRAYMHGYFMDMRLYRKAKTAVQPFEFDQFKKKRIREKLQEDRTNRVKLNTLPKVNKDLALKLMSQRTAPTDSKKVGGIMEDDRFKAMFQNPDFEVDKSAEEYRLINPVLSKLDKKRDRKLEGMFKAVDEEVEGRPSSDEGDSSDDDEWIKEVREERMKKLNDKKKNNNYEASGVQPKFYEIKQGQDFKMSDMNSAGQKQKLSKVSLGERVEKDSSSTVKARGPLGSREMSFTMRSRRSKESFRDDAKKHHEERRKIRRSAGGLKSKKNAWKK